MKLLHMSDTHVGHAAYSRLTPDGLNQREEDFFKAFSAAIDVAIERRVDVVLHSGDLFDTVRPTNRALSHVLSELQRLAVARIPFVVISGNHEAPRLRETGAVLRLLEFLPGVHAVYKGRYEPVRVNELVVHAVPHAADSDALRAQLALVHRDESARYNVATLHAGVLGVGDFRTGEFHEQVVAQNELPRGMDYVALGHYHRAVELADKVWYAGSTERCSFKEYGETKSVNLVDLAKGTVECVPLASRPMLDLPRLACQGMDEHAIAAALYERLASPAIEGAIARLKVEQLPAHVYAMLDFRRIRALTASAMHFELQTELVQKSAPDIEAESFGALADEFDGFLARRALVGADREALLATAKELLHAAEAPI